VDGEELLGVGNGIGLRGCGIRLVFGTWAFAVHMLEYPSSLSSFVSINCRCQPSTLIQQNIKDTDRSPTDQLTNNARPPQHVPNLHRPLINLHSPRLAQTTNRPHPQPTTLAKSHTRTAGRPHDHSPHHSHQLRRLQHHDSDSDSIRCRRDDRDSSCGADVVRCSACGRVRSNGVREL
jgi:hypothetical protein